MAASDTEHGDDSGLVDEVLVPDERDGVQGQSPAKTTVKEGVPAEVDQVKEIQSEDAEAAETGPSIKPTNTKTPESSPAKSTSTTSPRVPPIVASNPLLSRTDTPPPRSPKRLSRGSAAGTAPGRFKPVGSVGVMKGMFEAKGAGAGGGLAPGAARGLSRSPPKRLKEVGKGSDEVVQKEEAPKTPPRRTKGKEVERDPVKDEVRANIKEGERAEEAEKVLEPQPKPSPSKASTADAIPVSSPPAKSAEGDTTKQPNATTSSAARTPAEENKQVDQPIQAIAPDTTSAPQPALHSIQPVTRDSPLSSSPGTALQPTFASRSSSQSSLRSFQPPSLAAAPRLDDASSLSDADVGMADEAVEDLAPVSLDLDDVPLDADAKDSSKTPTVLDKATGGLFGGKGFGFLSRSSSGASGLTASSSNSPGTPTAPRLERTASSSSSFSLTESAAPQAITSSPPPAPARTASSSWRTGLTALLGGSSPNAAASSSAAQPSALDSHSPRETVLSGGRLAPSSFPKPSLVAAGSSRLLASENAARRDLAAASLASPNSDGHGHEVSAEDFDDGEDLSGDEVGATPRKRGRRRSERGEEVAVEDGIVGGVDWSFWGAVMSDYEDVARSRPKELSKAIQQGIPAVIRGTMWQLMSSSKSTELEARYSALLKLSSPHEKSIQKDLARTFPSHAYFQQAGGVGQENLFNVVKAYSLYDPDVGYTQGLAFIVAPLLLLMPEEEAFCVLVRLMESYDLRSHFLPEMPGLQMRLYQFDRLVEELLPVLHLHFVRKGVKSSMFASQWFMTMFSYRFPLALVFRIYDIVFAEGIEAVFRFSLALLHKNEAEILALDFEGCLKYLQAGLFATYKQPETPDDQVLEEDHLGQGEWQANAFVEDAYAMRISPFMLDNYAGEHFEHIRAVNAHAVEMDVLRNVNRNLSSQVKNLEAALASMNTEHVELVRQLVNSRIEKEEIENELVKYKVLYAELSHNQQESRSPVTKRPDSRSSSTSTTRKLGLWA